MTESIVECVPNFSEAKRPEVIDSIIEEIIKVDNVWVLDRHSDKDHNRTVVTFVGSPQAVEDAAFNAIAKASELINLDEHTGEHPRIGATDVVPFIPISNVTMDDCIQLAKRLGKRVGEELNIPVYLYEEAATQPDRRNLANIRKGEYEQLKKDIKSNQLRSPDFGPRQLSTAGATVIGAREFLIAYNIYLSTDQVEIAKKIARSIRHSNGGLRYVKALGLLVEGKAQVSMNLTNFRKTPLPMVVETVRREAKRYGVNISHSELVGLIPQDAVSDTMVWYTQLGDFKGEQILEKKMFSSFQEVQAEAKVSEQPEAEFTDELAAGTAAPGGGSAAAYAGAMSAALTAMVTRLTLGRDKYDHVKSEMESILKEAETLREILLAAVEADSAAFLAVMDANRLPRSTEEEKSRRASAIQEATLEAADIPLKTAQKSLRVLQLAVQTAHLGNPYAITDAGTAAELAQAAIHGAGYNVRINLLEIKDQGKVKELTTELEDIESKAAEFMVQIKKILIDRGGLQLP
jgi:glutamate formiminotransferase/formiminotetrahydrofolate cyclodeaminase